MAGYFGFRGWFIRQFGFRLRISRECGFVVRVAWLGGLVVRISISGFERMWLGLLFAQTLALLDVPQTYQSNGFKKSTSPQNGQRIVYNHLLKQSVDGIMVELSF